MSQYNTAPQNYIRKESIVTFFIHKHFITSEVPNLVYSKDQIEEPNVVFKYKFKTNFNKSEI
jgi:hypothetical protein